MSKNICLVILLLFCSQHSLLAQCTIDCTHDNVRITFNRDEGSGSSGTNHHQIWRVWVDRIDGHVRQCDYVRNFKIYESDIVIWKQNSNGSWSNYNGGASLNVTGNDPISNSATSFGSSPIICDNQYGYFKVEFRFDPEPGTYRIFFRMKDQYNTRLNDLTSTINYSTGNYRGRLWSEVEIEAEQNDPTVSLTSCPSTLSGDSYTFRWSGSDIDGDLDGYYYELDDSTPNDFTRSTSVTISNISTGSHTFYIYSVDDAGNRSSTRSCSFTKVALQNNPTVSLTSCPSTLSGDSYTFRWSGSDVDGDLDGFYYELDDSTPNDFTRSTSVTINNISAGNHAFYIYAVDDQGNRSSTRSCSFTKNGTSDLISSYINIPSTAESGEVLNFSGQSKNVGTGGSNGFYSRFVRVASSSTSNIQVLESFGSFYNSGLDPNEDSPVHSINQSVPSQSGTYYYTFQVDHSNQIDEGSNEGNNFYTPIQSVTVQGGPDLIASYISIPSTSEPGEILNFSAQSKNVGTGGSNGFYSRFVRVASSSTSNIQVLESFGSFYNSGLDPNEDSPVHSINQSVPAQSGTYYYTFQVDHDNRISESGNEGNNYYTPIQTVNVSGSPDLIASHIAIPTSAAPGEIITFEAQAKNVGNTDAGQFSSRFVRVASSSTSNIQVLESFGSFLDDGLVPNEDSSPHRIDQAVPTQPGTYYYSFQVDYDSEVTEVGLEGNNYYTPIQTVTVSGSPDLIASHIAIPTSATPGETITFEAQAKNIGNTDAGQFSSRFVRVASTSTSNIQVLESFGSFFDDGLVPNEDSSPHRIDQAVPTQPGTYYYSFRVDYNGEVTEEGLEENNYYTPIQTVNVSGSPDLIASHIAIPTSAAPGETITFEAQAKNIGNTDAGQFSSRFVRVASSSTSNIQVLESFGSFLDDGLVPNEDSSPHRIDQAVPTQPGTYYYSFQVDYNSEVTEVGLEGNNFYTPIQTLVVESTCPFTSPSSVDAEQYEAFCYLCAQGIINCVEDGRPNDLLIRQDLAKVGFKSVGLNDESIFTLFKSIWFDLRQSDEELHAYAVALSYLDFGDGISPFTRENFLFNPSHKIQRQDLLKFYLELFNIAPDEGLSETANDMNLVNSFNVGYVKKALSLGIVETDENGDIRPRAEATRAEAFVMVYRILIDNTIPKPSLAELENYDSYFLPLNYQFGNLGQSKSAIDGVFKNYVVGAFNIADKGFTLDFSAAYNSYLEELPGKLFPYEEEGFGEIFPMGPGWTHNYFHYLLEIDGVTFGDGKENDHIVWVQPEGEMVVFENDGANYPIQTYGYFGELSQSGSNYIYTDKYQTKYHFSNFTSPRLNGDKVYHLVAIVDRNGNTLTINYDQTGFGRTTEVVAPSGRKLLFEYEGDKLIRVIDNNLNPTREVTFTYQNGQISTFTDAVGNVTQFSYTVDSSPYKDGKLSVITLPRGNTITTTYNDWGRVETIENESGVRWENLYENPIKLDQSTTTISDTGVYTEEIVTSFSPLSLIKSIKGESDSGSVIDDQYTRDHRDSTLITGFTQFGSLNWSMGYDDQGNLETYNYEGLSASIGYHPVFNLPTRYTDFKGNSTTITRNDSNGNAERILAPGNNNETIITYFDWGGPETVTNPEGITVTYGYNNYGNPTSITAPEGIVTTQTYDGASRLKTTTLDGRTSGFHYDLNDNLTDFTDARGKITGRAYDANQNLQTVTNALGKTTSFTYFDDQDWLKTISFGGFTRQYDYYENGLLKEVLKPSGQRLTYTYDGKNRFASDGEISEVRYNVDQTVQSITNTYGKLTLGYDQYQRINSSDWEGNEVTYQKDNNGNVTQVKYGNAYEVNRTYDAQNRLIQVKWFNQVVVSYDYLEDGRLKRETFGNGVITDYTHDDAGREKTRRTTKPNNELISGYTYDWSPSGNINQITKEHDENTGSLYATIDKSYAIDANTNRITNFINGGQSATFTFDADGNTNTNGNFTYTWDIKDRMTSLSGNGQNNTYTYDPNNLLQTATRNGVTTTYIWDIHGLGDVIAILEEGAEQSYFIHGLGTVARVKNGEIAYYHCDFSGNIKSITTPTANISHRYVYDPFGNLLQSEESDFNPLRFSGKYGILWENDGLYYVRARYYDSEIGRFLSEDPVWSTNLYSYSGNNPITQIDPSGQVAFIIPIAIIAFEVALTIYDAYEVHKTLNDPNASDTEKSIALAGFTAGLYAPGGGYGTAGKAAFKYGNHLLKTVKSTNAGEYLFKNWYKGTFENRVKSIKYHLDKHGKGRTALEYTKDAAEFFRVNKSQGENIILKDGSRGIRIQTKKIIDGKKMKIGGIWTIDGQIVTFWD